MVPVLPATRTFVDPTTTKVSEVPSAALMVTDPAATALTAPRTASCVTKVPVFPSLVTQVAWLARDNRLARPARFLCLFAVVPVVGSVLAAAVTTAPIALGTAGLTAAGVPACASGAPDHAEAAA